MASIYRVRTAITGGTGAAQVSTMYFEDAGALTAQDAADAVRTFWNDIRGHITNQYAFQVEPAVFRIHVEDGQPTGIVNVSTSPVTGGDSGGILPYANQGLIRWNTGEFIGGRQVLGHTFIPGCLTSDATGSAPSATYRAALDAAAATLNGSSVCNLMIYSRKNLQAVNVLGGAAWTKFAVLRSRRD